VVPAPRQCMYICALSLCSTQQLTICTILHSELILFSIADGDESQEALEHSLVVDYERKLAAKRREVARLQQQRDKLMQTQRRLMELQGLIGDVCLMKLWLYDIDSSFLHSDSVFGSADSQVQVSSCFSPPV